MSYLNYFFAGALIFSGVLLLGLQGCKLWKEALLGAFRAAAQLVFMGFLLQVVFKVPYWWAYVPVMWAVAAWTGAGRIKAPGGFWVAGLAVALGSLLSVLPMVPMGVISWGPHHVIPLLGMAMGNAVNSLSLAAQNIRQSFRDRWEVVEGAFALGARPLNVVRLFRAEAFAAGTVSARNALKVVGIVQIPGAAVGMMVAGVEPLRAMLFQMAIVYMLFLTVVISVSITVYLGGLLYLNPKFLNQ